MYGLQADKSLSRARPYTLGMGGRARASRGNLPAEFTSFIGRRRQLQEVKAGLSAGRLLTLVGPGGVGKTRLALRVATDLQRAVPAGVWLVELGGLSDAELVAKAVMTSMGLRDESSVWPVSRLIDYVVTKRLLLILDNCEHLLDACAILADVLLREARDLRILATSRQPLGIAGEKVVQVAPLSVPDATERLAPERIAQSEAVMLLLERAGEAGRAFELTSDNQAAVVELTRRLDGIPLAIELAAVRLRSLGLAQVVERLGRIDILVNSAATVIPQDFFKMGDAELTTLLDQKFNPAARCIRHVVANMRKRKWGRIINISGLAGRQPHYPVVPAALNNSAMLNLTKALAAELAKDNILVNAVVPYIIDTERQDETMREWAQTTGQTEAEVRQQRVSRLPVGRMGRPEEVAAVVAFMASERSSYVVGTAWYVDGGGSMTL